jgi:hypothetical protein
MPHALAVWFDVGAVGSVLMGAEIALSPAELNAETT